MQQQRLALALGHHLPAARVLCLQIAALQVGPEYNPHFANLYTFFIAQLAALMPPGTNIPEAYARGSDEDQAFVQNLALFLTAFFRAHLGWVAVQWGSRAGAGHVPPNSGSSQLRQRCMWHSGCMCPHAPAPPACAHLNATPALPALNPSQWLPSPTGRVLETSEELRAALIQGLDTLVAISYVDDDEVGEAAGGGSLVPMRLFSAWRHGWRCAALAKRRRGVVARPPARQPTAGPCAPLPPLRCPHNHPPHPTNRCSRSA